MNSEIINRLLTFLLVNKMGPLLLLIRSKLQGVNVIPINRGFLQDAVLSPFFFECMYVMMEKG